MRRILATLMVLSLGLLSCGEAEPGGADAAADAGAGEGGADVALADTELGEILVDGDGMTLYLFTRDEDGQSVCEDACAQAWPPLLSDAPVAGDGIDAARLDTTTRGDGTTQVTYNGWPLYTWAGDQQAGDVTGQGVEGVWFVLGADGDAIGAEESATDDDTSDGAPTTEDEDTADEDTADEDTSTDDSY